MLGIIPPEKISKSAYPQYVLEVHYCCLWLFFLNYLLIPYIFQYCLNRVRETIRQPKRERWDEDQLFGWLEKSRAESLADRHRQMHENKHIMALPRASASFIYLLVLLFSLIYLIFLHSNWASFLKHCMFYFLSLCMWQIKTSVAEPWNASCVDSVNQNISKPQLVKTFHLALLFKSSIEIQGIIKAGGQAVRRSWWAGTEAGKRFVWSLCTWKHCLSADTKYSAKVSEQYINNLISIQCLG